MKILMARCKRLSSVGLPAMGGKISWAAAIAAVTSYGFMVGRDVGLELGGRIKLN